MFKKAKAIFIKGGNDSLNNFADFKAKINSCDNAKIRITANYFYKLYVNENFVAFGPSRTAYGYARVDEFEISNLLKDGENVVDVVVAGFNCKSLSTCKFNSFITAEIECGGNVIAYTGKDFKGYQIISRVKEVNRYSKQRHFCEVVNYNLGNDFTGKEIEVVEVNEPKYLSRGVNYPTYEILSTCDVEVVGDYLINTGEEIAPNYSWKNNVADKWGGFSTEEVKFNTYDFIKRLNFNAKIKDAKMPLSLKENEYLIIDFKQITTGFLGLELESVNGAQIAVGFTEYSDEYKFNFVEGFNTSNAFEYLITGGETTIETFEPFTAKKLLICVKNGSLTIKNAYIRKYEGNFESIKHVDFISDDLNKIYEASINTFKQNVLDIYMDCPSRERGGWLCDSYFTSKTEYFLTGKTTVEDNFLENYALFENLEGYEDGMIPMLYPSDYRLQFIPQWSMWFIIELHEYIYERKGKFSFDKFERLVSGLLKYYKKYENEQGLLEKLSNWNFVEWSKANDLTEGVNYPTNFLYAKVLDCVADFYNDDSYRKQAKKIRNICLQQSFDGNYFHDLAVRDEKGELKVTEDITEICQYYAINFGDIDINDEKFAKLKYSVTRVFNIDRTDNLEIEKINMFIGVYLKLLALEKINEPKLLIDTVKDYFLPMANKTNTLWENVTLRASLCHGFASFATVQMTKASKELNLIK